MKRILIALGCLLGAVLLWRTVSSEEKVEIINCGNGVELIKKTSISWGIKRSLYGVNKHGTCLLAPIYKMIENERLKLRVLYGQNSKIHIFNTETGEKVLTGKVSRGYCPGNVWFSIDDKGEEKMYVLMADYTISLLPYQYGIDTIAVFTVKDGKTCLINTK